MNLRALLKSTYAYGGPYKLLLLNLRPGQLIGALLAMSCYAWIVATLSSSNLPVAASNNAIVAIGSVASAYLLAMMAGTWWCFDAAWFEWINILGDVLGIAGSIAVAILTRGSTGSTCAGLFVDGEEGAFGEGNMSQACKLQKVVFATGVCNAIMFFVTLCIFVALRFKVLDRAPGKGKGGEGTVDGDGDGRQMVESSV